MIETKYKQTSNNIFYSDGGFCAVDYSDILHLKAAAIQSEQKRSRICFHATSDDQQQEMLIAAHKSSYIRPHRHIQKTETLTIIEGKCDALLFDKTGNLINKFSMTCASERDCFFYRMPPKYFHSLIIESEWLIFLETTIGPFNNTDTEQAQWAPESSETIEGLSYLKSKLLI